MSLGAPYLMSGSISGGVSHWQFPDNHRELVPRHICRCRRGVVVVVVVFVMVVVVVCGLSLIESSPVLDIGAVDSN